MTPPIEREFSNPLTLHRQQQERERFDLWARTEWDPEDFQDPHHSIAMDAAWKAWWARANQPGVHLLV